MDVLFLVACDTSGRQFRIRNIFGHMAGITANRRMSTRQWIFRVSAMVK
jgi:hypothetical protein